MLRTEIRMTARDGQSIIRWVEIANVGGRAGLADYRVCDVDASRMPLATAKLEGYPRWSEPVGALVARAMDKLWTDGPVSGDGVELSHVEVETDIVPGGVGQPRVLGRWFLRLDDGFVESWDEENGVRKQSCALTAMRPRHEVVLECQCLVAWAHRRLPPWPKPLVIPVQRHADVPYVRLEDIPQPARWAFRDRMRHSTYPIIPGEGACFYYWDWCDFLAGAR